MLPILIIPFVIGLFDDLIQLTPSAKLIAQLLTATLIFFVADIRLDSFYGLAENIAFASPVSYLATVATVVLITNSLNLIDGIDGLAASFSFVACMTFGSWFYFTGEYPYAILCLSLAGAILAFLFQNWEPSNIFMGDTGSLVIGTVLSVVTIHFMHQNYILDSTHRMKFESSIGTAICFLILPLTDTIRVMIIRLLRGLSLFQPDKRHIHHALVRMGLSHRQSVCLLILIHILMILLAILLRKNSQWILLVSAGSLATVLCLILDQFINKALTKDPS